MGVVVRRIEDPRELEEAVECHASAWGSRDYREVAPAHLLRGLALNGGLVLGAFIDGRLVGASYGWVVCDGGGRYLYSHATGVAEGYKYRGVGYQLKLAQRREALAMGIDLVKWTFDPLQSLNSRFNLSKLGAVYREYHVDYYGEMRDEVNRGLGSDRVVAEWWIRSRLVEEKLSGRLAAPSVEDLARHYGAQEALGHGEGLSPGEASSVDSDIALVAIPQSIADVRRADPRLAVEWRAATRRALRDLTSRGYIGVEYSRDSRGRPYHVLVRMGLEEVLESLPPWAQRR